MQVSPILRKTVNGHGHWCPACQEVHILPDSWTFNGDVKKPTFSPSFKHTFVRWTGGIDPETHLGRGEKRDIVCHYIINDGKIQFCPDSWHGRSDIVMMPLLPQHAQDLLAPEPVPTLEFGKETQD